MSYRLVRWSLYQLVCVVLIVVSPLVILTGGALASESQVSHPAYTQPGGVADAVEETASLAQDASPTTRTDHTGQYRFEGLPRGTHKVTLDLTSLPRALRLAKEESAPTVWVIPGQEQTSDALISGVRFTVAYDRDSGAIAGRVFVDKNGDGLQGLGEAGLAGVTVIDPTIHQYFVPFDDRNLIAMFRDSNTCQGYQGSYPVGRFLTSGVSIVASWDGTVWYYDHWEDGYDPDPLNPDPLGTTETGILNAAGYQPFINDIDTSRLPWPPASPPYYYDGGDRITIVGEEPAVIRYAYPQAAESGIGGMLAGAWEIEQTANWGTAYVIPAGEDWGLSSDFEFTGASVMAMQDGTQVYLNGVLVATLSMGGTFFVNGAGDGPGGGGLDSGDTFTATGPIMTSLYGSLCDLSAVDYVPWSGNGYTLEPLVHWANDYWSPVPSRVACMLADTDIFLYNDNPVTITVRVDDGIPADIFLPPHSSSSVRARLGRSLAGDRGTHLYSLGGEAFWGIVNVDTRGTNFEWGFSLVHDPASQALLGWSPGNATLPDPMAYYPPNGNMAWVTPVSDTVVYVDLNGDGAPDDIDCNGDGIVSAMGVDGICDEPGSASGIPLLRGQTLRVGDPVDANLAGARIYTGDYNENISVAWGEDSCVADPGLPYLDLGYTVLPLISHSLVITKTAEPSPVLAGGVLTYSLAWSVLGFSPAPDLTISDTVPANTTLITATLPVTVDGLLLTWPLGDRLPGDSGAVTFTVQVATSVVSGTLLRNVTVITDSTGITDTDTITTPVVGAGLGLDKQVVPLGPVLPGDTLTYTICYSNTGTSTLTDVVVADPIPVNATYVPGSATTPPPVSGPDPLVWSVGTLLPGELACVGFRVQINPTITGANTCINTATITGTSPTGVLTSTDSTTVTILAPGLELTKDVTPGEVVSGMPFTYTIRITNTGTVTFSPLVLTDTLPPNIFYVGPAVPRPPDLVAEPLLRWDDLGLFPPGASISVTFPVTATPGITGTYINTATVAGHTPTEVLIDTDTVPVVFHDPEIALDKQFVSYDDDLDVPPNYVTFTIAIANVGPSVIDVLPLYDRYDPYYLSFVRATPYPDEPADDGVLTWYDLTLLPNGFGRNLGLGEVFTVTTVFSIVHDITTTWNTADVIGAIDVYQNPANRPRDQVPISDAPTAVELLYFRGESMSDRQVRLAWATAVEVDNLGFNVYRADEDDWSRASLIHFEPAAVMGAHLGASYVYTDTVPLDGVWWYWLVDVDTEGAETHANRPAVRVEVNTPSRYRVYLPVMLKKP